ncbi:MAG: phosphopantetheine-binding protein [Phycisphaerae bacterium]
MGTFDRDAARQDLIRILTELRDDWEYSGEITEKTGLFTDLEFESIDAVALGSAIEDHYNQSLPFSEFLTKAGERQAKDIYVAELIDFLTEHVRADARPRA